MKIGFYGHSNCAFRSQDSFIDIIAKNLNAEIVNTGVRQGSEERILFELKKSKDLDLAIIFHSRPSFLFLPNCKRDMALGLGKINQSRLKYLLEEKQIPEEFQTSNNTSLKSEFKDLEYLKNVLESYQAHFYNPILVMNRYYGALLQIDRYLEDKKIPCIHVLEKETVTPNWFTFKSGIVDFSIMEIVTENPVNYGDFFVNLITKEGNLKVADKLLIMIKELLVDNIPRL
jgi:hypothetical protein